jgi:hypothetical protein
MAAALVDLATWSPILEAGKQLGLWDARDWEDVIGLNNAIGLGKSFEEILLTVYNICEKVKGVGMLTVYDIVAAICRFNNINIERVYIIGGGPVRAARLLNIKLKTHKIEKIALKYIEISEIIEAFDKLKLEIDSQIKYSNNGDEFETYICNWQKDK